MTEIIMHFGSAVQWTIAENRGLNSKGQEDLRSICPVPGHYNTFDKNSLNLGFFGFSKNSFGWFSSWIFPSSMKITLDATSLANPISWVTTTMVIPDSASSFISSSTSPTISGSRAEVGSSNSITSGFIASALAIAILCFWPPESMSGYVSAFSGSPTHARSSSAFCDASLCVMSFNFTGASIIFSFTVMFGKRLNCWNTMPIFWR